MCAAGFSWLSSSTEGRVRAPNLLGASRAVTEASRVGGGLEPPQGHGPDIAALQFLINGAFAVIILVLT